MLTLTVLVAACGTAPGATEDAGVIASSDVDAAESGQAGGGAAYGNGSVPSSVSVSGSDIDSARQAVVRVFQVGDIATPTGEAIAAGTGTGFIIDPSGLAVTNNHVAAPATISMTSTPPLRPSTGSPADKAGIRPGDFVIELEGVPLATDGTLPHYCDIAGAGVPYTDFVRFVDDTGVMSFQVPSAFVDASTVPLPLDGYGTVPVIAAAENLRPEPRHVADHRGDDRGRRRQLQSGR